MNAIRILSGVSLETGESFVQLRTDADPPVVLTQMTAKEAAQMGVYLISAAADANNDAAAYRYLAEVGRRAGIPEDRAVTTATGAIEVIRECRITGKLNIPGVANG